MLVGDETLISFIAIIAINEDPLRLDPMTNYDWSSRPKRVNCDLTFTEPRLRWKVKINFHISEKWLTNCEQITIDFCPITTSRQNTC